MTLKERLRQLASALPSDDSAITFTRADLVTLLEADVGYGGVGSPRDLTVEEVAEEMSRAQSTIRGWLTAGSLRGYKLNNRDWRVPRAALREYLEVQATQSSETPGEVDIRAWRKAGDT